MKCKVLFAVALLSAAAFLTAAEKGRVKSAPNAKSPAKETSVSLGGSNVKVEYSAPSLRGRGLDTLAPQGKVWRTGADGATTLTTDTDLTFGDVKLPKGVYSLYTIPGQSQWHLIVNKEVGQWGTEYDKSQDLGHVLMKVTPLSSPVEQLSIELKSTGVSTGELLISWGGTQASAAFIK